LNKSKTDYLQKRIRLDFSKVPKVEDIPNLIKLQRDSYEKFLQMRISHEKRADAGLHGIFKSVFPITDLSKTASLEYVGYILDEPKYDVAECRQRGMTYAAPMRVTVRLVMWDYNEETQVKSIRDVKEQEVYFGEIPLMTENGTFVINGTERVVVSQLHRSPGVFFEHDKGQTHSSGKLLYSARIIPYRGSWIDFEFDHKDILYVRIDRRRKMLATILLRALGYSTQEILEKFYPVETITIKPNGRIFRSILFDYLADQYATRDILNPKTGEALIKKNKKFTKKTIKDLESLKINVIEMDREEINGKFLADDVVDEQTGEILFESNEEFNETKLNALIGRGITEFKVLYIDNIHFGPYLRDTLALDKINSSEEALMEIYRHLRPGEPSTSVQANNFFKNLFFSSSRYDLSSVGRLKINYKFGENIPLEKTTLRSEDIVSTIHYLLDLKMGKPNYRIDDIDHLGNRRVRTVGELMENQYRIGLVRMERAIREKMSMSQDLDTMLPHDFINAKPVSAVIREYFGSSQLSQFMDQTNPLAEITHKRRVSALGPGGLTRDRAGFEVRDVHATHYGRICPIETPEGPNIGLIASLSTYARVNDYGFIETPYIKVVKEIVKENKQEVEKARVMINEVVYLSALEEEEHVIAPANTDLDENNYIAGENVSARKEGEFVTVAPTEITLIDVSPTQLVSVAASLVPFLEHDDANRALMGSNMQRQAVPLLKAKAPLVGTNMEAVVAQDSGVVVTAKNNGIVESVDANRIVIKRQADKIDESLNSISKPDIYSLIKYQKSNQNTCINQKPIVLKGQKVRKGEVIADGSATEMGELALGQNVLVAFMPWGGYNFEDSILVSERLVREDLYTSIHMEEFDCIARDTKLGKEEITRDIPNVGEESLRNLDNDGIIRIGAEVRTGDILVGKVTPRGETQLSPEEKLLRAIFGEKAADVKDSSLRVPAGINGIVMGAKIFSRKGADKDERLKDLENIEEQRLNKDKLDEIKTVQEAIKERIGRLVLGKKSGKKLVMDKGNEILLKKGEKITKDAFADIPFDKLKLIVMESEDLNNKLFQIIENAEDQINAIETLFNDKIKRLKKGDELPPGVIKMIKVYVAMKRKLNCGDKMAGRHGNKGVLSRILPLEDLPYLSDGTPVDVVLNPLGVPSRMNVGQILEAHLGWAMKELGNKITQIIEKNYSFEKLKKALQNIFSTAGMKKIIDEMDEEQVLNAAKSFRNGIFTSSPVFDGSDESVIKDLLKKADLPENGKTILFDGRTGDAFDSDVTVGTMYIMKLNHLVDDKIHARSTGPYSLVTQQPLGGKAQFGGQRLGEMEVWAMEAYGAAYGLQEFLTIKSDDVAGRTDTYEAIVKGDYNLHVGLPESFNVLVKELKSLAIDVDLLESEK
jgi:DNA-directed RNA polymerase subunit beta